jgi:hypothetical protein
MNTKAISVVEAAIKKDNYNKIVGIREFTSPGKLWMQKACKFYRKNGFNLGIWSVNWEALNKGHKAKKG